MAENVAIIGKRLIWFIKNLLANQGDHAFLGKILKQSKDIYLTFYRALFSFYRALF